MKFIYNSYQVTHATSVGSIHVKSSHLSAVTGIKEIPDYIKANCMFAVTSLALCNSQATIIIVIHNLPGFYLFSKMRRFLDADLRGHRRFMRLKRLQFKFKFGL